VSQALADCCCLLVHQLYRDTEVCLDVIPRLMAVASQAPVQVDIARR
jgi:hypothetical protein